MLLRVDQKRGDASGEWMPLLFLNSGAATGADCVKSLAEVAALVASDARLICGDELLEAYILRLQAGTKSAGLTLKYLASLPARVALIFRFPDKMADRLLCGTISARSPCFRPRAAIR